MMGRYALVQRSEVSLKSIMLVPLVTFVLALLGSMVLFGFLGAPPLEVLYRLLIDPLASAYNISEVVIKAAPLILIAQGLAIGFRAKVWNIGAEGQLIIGAVAASVIPITFPESQNVLMLPAMMLAGMIAGAAWAGIAAALNPDLKPVKVVWLNAWYDPPRDRSSAESLISQGADVVYSLFPGTPSAVATAEEKGVYAVTTLSDNSAHAPTKHLCAGQANFGVVYADVVQSVIDGTFEGKDTFAGVAEGAMEVAGLSPDLTEEQRAAILAKQDAMSDGSFDPFTGPVMNNDGSEAIASGKRLDASEIKSMNFLVQGIDSRLQK